MPADRSIERPQVVIVGAGFGGLEAARALRKAPVNVLLIDRNNYHTFQPLLYQVATAGLEPEEIAHAVRGIFHRHRNFDFRMATVTGVDPDEQSVVLADGERVRYDFLVLAAGASTNDFGVPGVREHAFPLKSLTDSIRLRSHILRQFESASADPSLIESGMLNFVVVGGGPTGVEMAGALVELFDLVLAKDFPKLPVGRARVILVEMADGVLAPFAPRLRDYALRTLRKRGVDVRLNTSVVAATDEGVSLSTGHWLPTRTLIWAAGVKANPLAEVLGLPTTRGGRIVVGEDLTVPGRENVFVIGDIAASKDEAGALHPQLAPVAIQGARYVARQIRARVEAGAVGEPFRYRDRGIMATIGRNAAVADVTPGIRTKGFFAWLIWLFLHLMQLVGFRNRLNVFINWAWNYVTYDRGARMIIDVAEEHDPRSMPELTQDSNAS